MSQGQKLKWKQIGLCGGGSLEKASQDGFCYHSFYVKVQDLVSSLTGSEPHLSVHVFR